MLESIAQRNYFGAELARLRKGQKPHMKGMSTAHLEKALHEAKGKKMPRHMSGGKPGTGLMS